jgi:hypothetical protein
MMFRLIVDMLQTPPMAAHRQCKYGSSDDPDIGWSASVQPCGVVSIADLEDHHRGRRNAAEGLFQLSIQLPDLRSV